MNVLILVLLLGGCRHDRASSPESVPVPVRSEPVVLEAPTPVLTPQPPGTITPAALYEQCFERVEGSESDGECLSNDDCTSAGCGNEVCTTKEKQAGVATSCEARLCFEVLDTCGCNEGRCRWALKSEMPEKTPVQFKLKLEESN